MIGVVCSMLFVFSCVISSLNNCLCVLCVLFGLGKRLLVGGVIDLMCVVFSCIVIIVVGSLMCVSCLLSSCMKCFLLCMGVVNVSVSGVGGMVWWLCLCLRLNVIVVSDRCCVVS